nr:protein phosphatase 1 regulatory subunit 42 [Cytophagaceae bacterium]
MYKRIPILFLWLLMNHLSAWTQSVVIPDPNFRAYLVSTHPTLMNGSQQLILSAANAFTGTVNCSNRSISNLSGIEHFHSMLTLDCSNNQISAFPSLASLSALQTLTCNNNQLSTINGLGSLTALRFLTCSHNQITSLPGLGNLTQLEILNLPGTTTPGRPRTSTVNGLPKSAINITIDGINAQDNLLKSTDGFFTYVRPRTDAIEEVTLSTANPGAESSAEGAVQIKFVTRGGTNEYHGGLYEYHRNPSLQANYWFNNRDLRAPAG